MLRQVLRLRPTKTNVHVSKFRVQRALVHRLRCTYVVHTLAQILLVVSRNFNDGGAQTPPVTE